MSNIISTDVVRDTARGRWLSVLSVLAPDLYPAIQKVGRHVSCPGHGGKDGFRLFRDADETGGGICNSCGEFADGFALLMWKNGWSFIETKQAVVDYLGLEPGTERLPPPRRRPPPVVQEHSEAETRARKGKLADVSRATTPDTGLIASYLKSRGLFLPPPESLRLHPALPYFDDDRQHLGDFPCMIARVELPDGTGMTLHRTWLAPDGSGKAPVPTAKKLMTPIRDGATLGAAIHLTEAGETLGLAEGIETALAVREACALEECDLPMWATVTAGGMEAVQIPDTVRRVEIWADHDTSGRGQEAAEILAQRMHEAGKEVYVFLPPQAGKDWLDVLNEQGHKAIWEARMQGKRWAPVPPTVDVPPDRKVPGRVTTFSEEEVMASEDPAWLIDGFLTEGGLSVLYGPSGVGKSFIAVDIAKSITAGKPWFGQAVKASPVYYVAAEGKGGYKKRLQAWELDRMAKSAHHFKFAFEPVPLMNVAAVQEFIGVLQALPQRPALVIFDTLARCMIGGDENNAGDVSDFVEGAAMIQRALGCAAMIIHHSGKGGTAERGSSALRAAADTMIGLTVEDDILVLAVDKQKDAEPPEPINLRMVPVLRSASCVMVRAEFSEASTELTKDQRKALKALTLQGAASKRDWQELSGMQLGPLMTAANALMAKGYVAQQDEKPFRYYVTGNGQVALQ